MKVRYGFCFVESFTYKDLICIPSLPVGRHSNHVEISKSCMAVRSSPRFSFATRIRYRYSSFGRRDRAAAIRSCIASRLMCNVLPISDLSSRAPMRKPPQGSFQVATFSSIAYKQCKFVQEKIMRISKTALDIARHIGRSEEHLLNQPNDDRLLSRKRIGERQLELIFDLASEQFLVAHPRVHPASVSKSNPLPPQS